MLAPQGIITAEDTEAIIAGRDSIRKDVESGDLEITAEYEDIPSSVVANLIQRIGAPG